MSTGLITLIILGAIALTVVMWAIGTYNRLVALRNQIENLWSQIDVQLKRRFDLIPNLVETVKGYATHEREVFEKIADARARMMSATGPAEQAQADNILTGALKSLFAISEAYPDLKANENFIKLQGELANTEDQIARSRELYNDSVMTYNTTIQSFPPSIIAGMGSFRQKPYFPIDEASREPVKVSFT